MLPLALTKRMAWDKKADYNEMRAPIKQIVRPEIEGQNLNRELVLIIIIFY
jgi:hypothetical protein